MNAKAHQLSKGMLKAQFKSLGLTPVQSLLLEPFDDEEGFRQEGRSTTQPRLGLASRRSGSHGYRGLDPARGRYYRCPGARIYPTEKASAIIADLSKTLDHEIIE